MTREQRIVETFVELADTMVDHFDVIEFSHQLAERCVELLECDEAGLLLADGSGVLRVMACSSERTETVALLESQHDEGPCFECYAAGEPVLSHDLHTDVDRWPRFAPAALARGVRAVHALPMRVRGRTVGTLNLVRIEPGRFPERDLPLGQGMADIAAIGLLQERTLREARGVVDHLQRALSSRVLIEQAKGVLAERAQIDVDSAFSQLRTYARSRNRRLSEIAHDLIEGRLETVELDGAAATER